ncbi:MFS transporter [Deinococcus sp.]|uniref:MFS transporter n=1 Tax=Deinococcus sp. TaxID=47478 RepID=UPI003CC67D18
MSGGATATGLRWGLERELLLQYALGFLAFFLMGLVQAGYGPSYGRFTHEYGVSLATVGVISSLHFLGTALGTLLMGPLLTRLSLRSSLAVAGGTLLTGLLGLAFAPAWLPMLGAALIEGVGFGMLSAGFNIAFARMGAGPSSLVNGMYGVGSVVSPLLVTLLASTSYRPPFVLMCVLAALLAVGVRWWWPRAPEAPQPAARVGRRAQGQTPGGWRAGGWLPLLLFGCCFFVYVGIEAGLGNWSTLYLTRLDYPHPALITSLYWAALTAGRFLFALVGGRFAFASVVAFGAAGTLLSALTLLLGGPAPAALMLAGLCIAPVFSALLAWFTAVLPAQLAPYMLAAGSLGGSLLPAAIGAALPHFGAPSLPAALLMFALGLLGLSALLGRRMRTQGGSVAPD